MFLNCLGTFFTSCVPELFSSMLIFYYFLVPSWFRLLSVCVGLVFFVPCVFFPVCLLSSVPSASSLSPILVLSWSCSSDMITRVVAVGLSFPETYSLPGIVASKKIVYGCGIPDLVISVVLPWWCHYWGKKWGWGGQGGFKSKEERRKEESRWGKKREEKCWWTEWKELVRGSG